MTEQREDRDGVIRIGTRGSELARTQAGHIRDALIRFGYPAELVIIRTEGDANRHDPVQKIGVGVFTQALRHALREGECDIAVHSFKDLPTAPEPDLVLGAVPKRADARDVLIGHKGVRLEDLAEGAKVGTSAPRRVSQLRAMRPDLDIRPLRGNIDTRAARVGNDLDAVILARAGLDRTDRFHHEMQTLKVEEFLPAPAQGALAVEHRLIDNDIALMLRRVDHGPSRARATAERMILEVLQAGCTAPVAAYSGINEAGELMLTAGVFAIDGSDSVVRSAVGSVERPRDLGRLVAERLVDADALDLMADDLR